MIGCGVLVVIGLLDNDEACLCPTRESLDFLVTAANSVMPLRCYAGECKTAEVDAREQPCLEGGHVLYRSRKWTLPVLQYLHENGCPWDSHVHSAAVNGHLPVLKYLHENGCPWNYDTCFYAADNKHWDCLQYAVDNKCPEWEYYAKKYADHLR